MLLCNYVFFLFFLDKCYIPTLPKCRLHCVTRCLPAFATMNHADILHSLGSVFPHFISRVSILITVIYTLLWNRWSTESHLFFSCSKSSHMDNKFPKKKISAQVECEWVHRLDEHFSLSLFRGQFHAQLSVEIYLLRPIWRDLCAEEDEYRHTQRWKRVRKGREEENAEIKLRD